MLMCANMRRVSTLRHNSCIRPNSAICIQLMATVRLVIILALAAHEAGVRLRAYADALSRLDERDFWTDAESRADNFYKHS